MGSKPGITVIMSFLIDGVYTMLIATVCFLGQLWFSPQGAGV